MAEVLEEERWRVPATAEFICSRNFTVVTLQLPDELLSHASALANAVTAACAARGHAVQVYVLADTTYNSLSVDEVAAAHIGAQCVVHYGRASLTPLSHLPAFFVFPEQPLDARAAAACLAGSALLAEGSSPVLVFLDQPLLHQLEAFREELRQALEQRQGPEAASRLVFPTVPQQHMEPAAAAGAQQPPTRRPAGCCGGGACGSGQQPQQQQQQQQAEATAAAGCGAAACPCPAAGTQQAAAAAPEPASSAPSAGSAPSSGQVSDGTFQLAGYQWSLPAGVRPQGCDLAWVGAPDAPALLQLQLTYSGCRWAVLDPALLPVGGGAAAGAAAGAAGAAALQEGLPLEISRTLRRRYFLVEKARDASIVGILVGTLGAAGYADAVQRLRAAAQAAGKKAYTLLMGKPSPAKLANFPEIEVFVLVADPQGQILDSKEYLAPIVTPHEAMLAFDPEGEGAWDEAAYRLDFGGVLAAEDGPAAGPRCQAPRFSLLSGGYTGGDGSGSDSEAEEGGAAGGDPGTALALHAQQALVVSPAPGGRSDLVEAKSAADYFLHKRTWQGVETPLVGAAPAPVEAAAEGRSGRAASYAQEGPGQAVK